MRLINQLSIEHSLNTNWEDQFDVHQLREIYEGVRKHIDVMTYANPQYHHQIMNSLKNVLMTRPDFINDALKIANDDTLSRDEKVRQISELK